MQHDDFEAMIARAMQGAKGMAANEPTVPATAKKSMSELYFEWVKQLQRIAALSVPEVDFLQGLYRAQVATQGFQSFQLQERIAQSLAKKGIVQYKPDAQGYQVKIHDQWSIG